MIFVRNDDFFSIIPMFCKSYRIPNASLPASHLRHFYILIIHLFIGSKVRFRPIKAKKTCAFYSNAFKVEQFFTMMVGQAA
jgi:hypothetical protein